MTRVSGVAFSNVARTVPVTGPEELIVHWPSRASPDPVRRVILAFVARTELANPNRFHRNSARQHMRNIDHDVIVLEII